MAHGAHGPQCYRITSRGVFGFQTAIDALPTGSFSLFFSRAYRGGRARRRLREAGCVSRRRCCSRKWRGDGLPPRSRRCIRKCRYEAVSEDRVADLVEEHFDVAIRINPRKESVLVVRCFARAN